MSSPADEAVRASRSALGPGVARRANENPAGRTAPGWRIATDVVTLVLGMNLWVAFLLVPGLYVGAFGTGARVVVLALPLLPLVFGIGLRSPPVLLTAYPAALVLSGLSDTRILMAAGHALLPFALVAAALVGYLFGVSFLTTQRELPPPERVRPLAAGRKVPSASWGRRFRFYRFLLGVTAVFPAVLLHAVAFDREHLAYLRELYPGRVRSILVVLVLGATALWLAIFWLHILGILRPHRTGDRELVAQLARTRAELRRTAPRPIFYAAVVGALFFVTLLFLRYG